MKLPKLYELKTWDKRTWALTEPEYKIMTQRLLEGARFIVIPDDAQSKVAPADIKFFGKRQISMGDIIMEQKALPQGEPKAFDPLSPGYIKFLAMKIKVSLKHGTPMSKVVEKITDEQKPLINEALKKLGVEFHV